MKRQTISQILIGDSLADLAEQLDIGLESSKLIAIAIHPGGARVAISEGMSIPECLGGLYMAVDQIAGRED